MLDAGSYTFPTTTFSNGRGGAGPGVEAHGMEREFVLRRAHKNSLKFAQILRIIRRSLSDPSLRGIPLPLHPPPEVLGNDGVGQTAARLLVEDQLDPFRVASLFDVLELTFIGATDLTVPSRNSIEIDGTEALRVGGRFEDQSDVVHKDLEGVFVKLVQVTEMLYVLEHVRQV